MERNRGAIGNADINTSHSQIYFNAHSYITLYVSNLSQSLCVFSIYTIKERLSLQALDKVSKEMRFTSLQQFHDFAPQGKGKARSSVFLLPAKHLGYSNRFNLEGNLIIDLI